MDSEQTERSLLVRPRRWLDGARQLAVASDRWFVACGRALTSVKRWARREAGLADGAARTTSSESAELDLLLAAPAYGDRAPHERSLLASEPAGVLPLWRALGRVVSQHAHSGYRSLQTDTRFWALLNLIQSFTREPQQCDQPEQAGLAVDRDNR